MLEALRYKLNLQFFAADDGGGTGDNPGNGKEEGHNPEEQTGGTNLGDKQKPGGGSGKPEGSEKVLTQSEVNDLIARETRKAQEKLLKQLGVKDIKSAKDGLEKFRQMQEEQMSEQERIARKAQELEQAVSTYEQENSTLKAQLAALKNDVDPDSLNDVIVLANSLVDEETDIDTAIKQVIEKYPHFKKKTTTELQDEDKKKPRFSTGQHQKQPESEIDKWIEAFKN